jgi:excisionase family DNA binding protein
MPDATPQFLTITETARALRVHDSTVYAMIHDGRLPAVRAGREWRINAQALAELGQEDGREARLRRQGEIIADIVETRIRQALAGAFAGLAMREF